MADKKRAGGKAKYLVFLIFGCALFYWVYCAVWLPHSLEYTVVDQGELNHEIKTNAVFANRESVLTASADGTAKYICDDGQRVRKGEEVASITPGGVNYGVNLQEMRINAPGAGLFYKECDGLEEIITPDNLINIDLAKLFSETEKLKKQTENKNTKLRNGSVGKIVDNLSPSYAFINLPSIQGMVLGQKVYLKVDSEEYSSSVVRLLNNPVGIVVKAANCINGSIIQRTKEVTAQIQKSSYGTIVPLSAVSVKDNKKGIYIAEDGVVIFKEIEVLDQNESQVCVKGITPKCRVVINPKEGIEGILVR